MKHANLLNVEEFAAAMGWKPSTVYQKVWRREVEFVRIGRSIRFKPETADRLIEAGTMPALEGQDAEMAVHQ
jgi:excisionase family DNA binding protein